MDQRPHVHDLYRAVVGNTLVIGNPTGYPREAPESGLFKPDFAIDVEPIALTEWTGLWGEDLGE